MKVVFQLSMKGLLLNMSVRCVGPKRLLRTFMSLRQKSFSFWNFLWSNMTSRTYSSNVTITPIFTAQDEWLIYPELPKTLSRDFSSNLFLSINLKKFFCFKYCLKTLNYCLL